MTRRQKDLFPDLPDGKKYVSDIPELVAEWHPTKNDLLNPHDLLYGSNKKVWWKCNEGHEWQTMVFNRALHGKGCPYCNGRRVSSTNNLMAMYPEVAKLWSDKNKISPKKIIAGSAKVYHWKCENGHEWKQSPFQLISKKFPCPHCEYPDRGDGLRKATIEFNFATQYPDLVAQWHRKNEKPASYYMPKSNDKVWWICEEGHDFIASIDSRTRGTGCPYCAGRLATSENNLSVFHPELLQEWDYELNGLPPEQYLPQSNKKVWWKCIKGHSWQSVISNRTGLGNGCPQCTNQTSKNELRIYTELSTVFDNVLHREKIDGVEVDIYLPNSSAAIEYDGKYWHQNKSAQDIKKERHLLDRGIKLLRIREAPLEQLSSHDIIIPMGSFITKPIINQIIEWLGTDTPYLCEKAFRAEETYLTYLDYFPSPFPEHSLANVNPNLAAEWHPNKNAPLTPDNFTQSAKPKVWWMCEEGHEWQATIYSRNLGGHSCPFCMGRKATKDTCMAATHPEMAQLFHPSKNGELTPEFIKAGTGKLLWWQCELGHEWQQTGDKLKRTKEPCEVCRSLAVKRPDIAEMWHPSKNGSVTPDDVVAGSGVNRWWQCTVNSTHVWRASPNNMTASNRKGYCPYCK